MAMGLGTDESVSPAEAGRKVSEAIKALNKEIGIKTLRERNVDESLLPEVARRAVTEGPAMFSPRKVDKDDLLNILQKAYAR